MKEAGVCNLLSRRFAYLDVLGCLLGLLPNRTINLKITSLYFAVANMLNALELYFRIYIIHYLSNIHELR